MVIAGLYADERGNLEVYAGFLKADKHNVSLLDASQTVYDGGLSAMQRCPMIEDYPPSTSVAAIW